METIEELPSYDLLADRESDAQGYVEQTVTCSGCENQFVVSIRNTGASLEAELADHKTHVTVVDDPIHEPDDPWDVEAYQRENLPDDPRQDLQVRNLRHRLHSRRSRRQAWAITALNRMLLVQYFSAIEAYLSDRLIRLVLDNPKAMSALVKGNKEWLADKIGVVELAYNPSALRDCPYAVSTSRATKTSKCSSSGDAPTTVDIDIPGDALPLRIHAHRSEHATGECQQRHRRLARGKLRPFG